MLGKQRGPCIKECKTEGFALDFTDLHHVFHLSFWQFFETIFHISFRYFFLETFFENKVCTIAILWWAPASPLSASDSPTALLPDVKQRQAYNTKLEEREGESSEQTSSSGLGETVLCPIGKSMNWRKKAKQEAGPEDFRMVAKASSRHGTTGLCPAEPGAIQFCMRLYKQLAFDFLQLVRPFLSVHRLCDLIPQTWSQTK